MKRVNVILEADLYDKARVVAFVKRRSLSSIVRGALSEWLARNVDAGTELLLAEKDEKRLLKILESDEFVPAGRAKKVSRIMNVFYSRTSLKYLSKLENKIRTNIVSAIDKLPETGNIKKLRGAIDRRPLSPQSREIQGLIHLADP